MEDHQLFLDFLEEAGSYWRSHGLQISLPLYVTQILPTQSYFTIDRIHLMSYDISPSSRRPSEVAKARASHAARGINALRKSGCPASKIWIGIPSYGTSLETAGHVKTFSDALHDTNNNTECIDTSVKDLRKAFERFQWDSPEVIRAKMNMVKKHRLGGIFVWELGQDGQSNSDSAGKILSAISEASTKVPHCEKDEVQTAETGFSEL